MSTTHAVLDIVTTSLDNFNLNLFIELVFLDLQKAFNAVSPNTLLTKLEHYGIRGSANFLIKSFLNRKPVMAFIRSERSGRSSPLLQKCRKAALPKKCREVSTTVVLNQGGFDEVVSRVRWTLDPSELK